MILIDGETLIEYTVNNSISVAHQITSGGNNAKKIKVPIFENQKYSKVTIRCSFRKAWRGPPSVRSPTA